MGDNFWMTGRRVNRNMQTVKQTITSLLAFARRSGDARKPLPRSLLATAAVVAGWLSINLLAYGALLLPAGEDASLVVARNAQPSRNSSSDTLPNTPFFGRAPVQSKNQPEVDLANIPITQLSLVLSGVLNSNVSERASALVSEKGKPAKRYFVGDALPGGAEVYSVSVDHIVLQRSGQMEKLTYPDEDGRPSVPMQQFTDYAAEAVEAAVSSVSDRDDKQQSIRERLEELREMARARQEDRRN
jgi:hypothetical protein